jgi:acyl-[acyl carrier protein]--UDP-N-acetylglucosamine O-acyltransferase
VVSDDTGISDVAWISDDTVVGDDTGISDGTGVGDDTKKTTKYKHIQFSLSE